MRSEITSLTQAKQIINEFLINSGKIFEEMSRRRSLINEAFTEEKHKPQLFDFENLSKDQYKLLKKVVGILETNRLKQMAGDNLIAMNPKAKHSNGVTMFLNGNTTVTKNLNRQKRAQLLSAYRTLDWDNEIFTDTYYIQTAMGLFDLGAIDFHEFETLLERYYAMHRLKGGEKYLIITSHLLNGDGEFSDGAMQYLIPSLPNFLNEKFDGIQLNNLRLLIQAFLDRYPAENFFFMVILDMSEFEQEGLAEELRNLNSLKYLKVTDEHGTSMLKIYFPHTIRHILRLVCYELNDAVPTYSLAGELTTADVDIGSTSSIYFRPKAVVYPGVPRNPKIHNYFCNQLSFASPGEHDNYHADNLSRQGAVFRNSVKRLKSLIRDAFLKRLKMMEGKPEEELFSKAIWQFTDGECGLANIKGLHLPPDNSQRIAQFFCEALENFPRCSYLFQTKSRESMNELTDMGILAFIDMARNIEQWHNIGFHPEYMIEKYRFNFEIAQKLIDFFTDDTLYNIFIFRIYKDFKIEDFSLLHPFIENKKDQLKHILVLQRDNRIPEGFLGFVHKPSKIKLEENAMVPFLTLLDIECNNLDFLKSNLKVIKIFIITSLELTRYPYLRNEVFNPFKNLLQQKLILRDQGIDSSNSLTCKELKAKLEKFVNHYSNDGAKNAPSENELKLLKNFLSELNNLIKPNSLGLKPGFLTTHKLKDIPQETNALSSTKPSL